MVKHYSPRSHTQAARTRSNIASQIATIAQVTFGFDRLRPGQQEVIEAILAGQDTLAVMPTGSGKSAIYQIAALMLPGATVIVSPLIALQQDQVETLREQQVAAAALINSTRSNSERESTFADLEHQKLEFLFLAPEQFHRAEILSQLQAAQPSLFVVDEAHCISEWGHDFRPDYLRLGTVVAALGHPPVLALTATASPLVREEIIKRLSMHDPQVIVRGFDRPNLWLEVKICYDLAEKQAALLNYAIAAEKPGIIYAATRKHTEELAQQLRDRGVNATAYHAGVKASDREQIQTAFMQDELEVIVATNAFGMGIDKANVRFVLHYDICDSLDAYYQEIGRAGRDGKPAVAVLFYCQEDLKLQRFFTSGGQLAVAEVLQVAQAIQHLQTPIDPDALLESQALSQSHLSKTKLTKAIHRLAEVEAIELLPTGEIVAKRETEDQLTAAAAATRAQERRKQFERSRLEMMRGYAIVQDCRRQYLLNYFGEPFNGSCGFCDNCKAGVIVEEETHVFPLNCTVVHTKFGKGQVMRYEGDKIVILFDTVGYKTFAIELVQRLLKQI